MRDALIKAGNPPEWVVYYGEGHGWALPKTKIDFYGRMEKLLQKVYLANKFIWIYFDPNRRN
jgi:hypothetical protein